jgi:hypothetical protein
VLSRRGNSRPSKVPSRSRQDGSSLGSGSYTRSSYESSASRGTEQMGGPPPEIVRLKRELKEYIDKMIEEQVPNHIKKHPFPTCPHAVDPISGLAVMSTTD